MGLQGFGSGIGACKSYVEKITFCSKIFECSGNIFSEIIPSQAKIVGACGTHVDLMTTLSLKFFVHQASQILGSNFFFCSEGVLQILKNTRIVKYRARQNVSKIHRRYFCNFELTFFTITRLRSFRKL